MYYDISPPLSEQTAVFPGDEAFKRTISLSFESKDHLELSSITSTLHIGAHADAPSHYSAEGESIDQRNLTYYIGSAQVIEVNIEKGLRIQVSDVALDKITEKRVLFKTNSFPDPDQWNNDFNSFAPQLLEELSHLGVVLVGIDTPSVDPWDSKALESHQMLKAHDLGVLEGIVLKDVPEGVYKLSALPLPIKGADASPVRAVLFKTQDWDRL
jgi:arylformamidase